MYESNERGRNRDLRSSALWGTGGRGGDGRSHSHSGGKARWWLALVAAFALAVPVSATAGNGNGTAGGSGRAVGSAHFVTPGLLKQAAADPTAKIQVIVQADGGSSAAINAVGKLGALTKLKRLDLVNGITVQIPAEWITPLSQVPGLTITPDAPVKLTTGPVAGGFSSTQLWPYVSGNADLWPSSNGRAQPTIAVVDSGIDPAVAGLGSRLLANVNLSTLATNTPGGDGLGHGTLVSYIAAGSGVDSAGADPNAPIVSLDVMDDTGQANVSDVINAADWILQHKDQYNIRVANFSLASTQQSNFFNDPLDQAVEKLWYHGVTVVAAAGNYGHADGTPSGVLSAPGNDPFVITVGAADLMGTGSPTDDTVPYWSSWGRTHDGFMKPDLVAPGRYMTGPVPTSSYLYAQLPGRIVSPGWMNLSGTSLAAPVVSGTVAELLGQHPTWTPDQVKGALMASARKLPAVTNVGQAGVGELDAVKAYGTLTMPNPNAPLEQYVVVDPLTGNPTFQTDTWKAAVAANPNWDAMTWTATWNVSWDAVSWDAVSWDAISWDAVSWDAISWDAVSWDAVSWDAVTWSVVSWDAVSWDAATADPGALGYGVSSTDLAALSTRGPVLLVLNGK